MSEHRRKTLRSFYCEEQLWQAIEKAARERDVTIDQFLNDAIRIGLEGPQAAPLGPAPGPPVAPAALPAAEHATFAMPAIPKRGPRPPAPSGAPPAPPRPTPAPAPAPAPPPAPPAPASAPSPPARPAGGGMPTVYVHYQGRAHPVAKERFVIGRGSQGTDLTIRDGNVSRKHAAVIFHSGNFYIQDLGSTNGVEYRGNKVDAKKIEEGDTFFICDHELQFSYRG